MCVYMCVYVYVWYSETGSGWPWILIILPLLGCWDYSRYEWLCFFSLFVCCWLFVCFEKGSYSESQVGLGLITWPKLVVKLWQFSCLSLPGIGVTWFRYHTGLTNEFSFVRYVEHLSTVPWVNKWTLLTSVLIHGGCCGWRGPMHKCRYEII